jgi:pSer/pThr/pTyr-binding forkhead associated (FHA) protein
MLEVCTMSMLTTYAPVVETRILPTRLLPAQLRSTDGAHLVARLPTQGDTIIGRAPDVTLQLGDDPYVSAHHAVITWDALLQMHVIRDIDSRNGTYVDDVQVTGPVRLVNGACIRLGITEVVYCAPRER